MACGGGCKYGLFSCLCKREEEVELNCCVEIGEGVAL
jgi:hypothetical protein